MKTLNAQAILAEAIRLIERHAPESEISDSVLEGLVDLRATLPVRMPARAETPQPPHLAPVVPSEVDRKVDDWMRKNGNPRLSPELRELADTIGDVEL